MAWVAVAQSTRLVNTALNPCLSGGPLPNTHSLLRSRALDSGRHFHCGIASGYHSGHNHIATLSYGTTVKHRISLVRYLTENLRHSWELENTLEFSWYYFVVGRVFNDRCRELESRVTDGLVVPAERIWNKSFAEQIERPSKCVPPLGCSFIKYFGLIMWPVKLQYSQRSLIDFALFFFTESRLDV